MKVFRVVVDSYPTADGKPFTDQPDEFWQRVVDHHNDGLSEDVIPDWVPDISEYMYTFEPQHIIPPQQRGAPISQDEQGYPLLVVPSLTRRHFFARHAAKARVDQLIEWGCVAHVESADIGPWT
ncbi:hypothetical protein ACMTN4_07345 [Rhodococcus globerulus]|uniref:hypothetical protein n=1 Tax=Rhodococcus globerulus TaxID=33008 RepID=UPI0039E96B90